VPAGRSPRCDLYPLVGYRDDEWKGRETAALQPVRLGYRDNEKVRDDNQEAQRMTTYSLPAV